ncbi:unnamed protein product [Caenorhabditis auriculariae]|uniref:Uncharacterized protein n=1 Tax=Caenorhabditis auriculariae TaxID=2777116 RepID=A0A8S1H0T9_9PELO|nr:unnamed protein product [Caenorhabditis auriculariae]
MVKATLRCANCGRGSEYDDVKHERGKEAGAQHSALKSTIKPSFNKRTFHGGLYGIGWRTVQTRCPVKTLKGEHDGQQVN